MTVASRPASPSAPSGAVADCICSAGLMLPACEVRPDLVRMLTYVKHPLLCWYSTVTTGSFLRLLPSTVFTLPADAWPTVPDRSTCSTLNPLMSQPPAALLLLAAMPLALLAASTVMRVGNPCWLNSCLVLLVDDTPLPAAAVDTEVSTGVLSTIRCSPEQSPPGHPHSHTAATLPGMLQTLLAAWQSELLYMEYLTPSYHATSPARDMQHSAA